VERCGVCNYPSERAAARKEHTYTASSLFACDAYIPKRDAKRIKCIILGAAVGTPREPVTCCDGCSATSRARVQFPADEARANVKRAAPPERRGRGREEQGVRAPASHPPR